MPPVEHVECPRAGAPTHVGRPRTAQLFLSMALMAGSCALLVACVLPGVPWQYRSETGAAAIATASRALPSKVPIPAPLSTAEVAPVDRAEAPELDAGTSGDAELLLCDLADISVALPPESCPAAPMENGAPPPEPSALLAPMCDPSAASIGAAIEIPEIDRGRFEPLPCDGERWLALLRSQAREDGMRVTAGEKLPRPSPQPSTPPLAGHDGFGALATQLAWPERTASSTLAVSHHRGLARQPGHPSRVYRPPSI